MSQSNKTLLDYRATLFNDGGYLRKLTCHIVILLCSNPIQLASNYGSPPLRPNTLCSSTTLTVLTTIGRRYRRHVFCSVYRYIVGPNGHHRHRTSRAQAGQFAFARPHDIVVINTNRMITLHCATEPSRACSTLESHAGVTALARVEPQYYR